MRYENEYLTKMWFVYSLIAFVLIFLYFYKNRSRFKKFFEIAEIHLTLQA